MRGRSWPGYVGWGRLVGVARAPEVEQCAYAAANGSANDQLSAQQSQNGAYAGSNGHACAKAVRVILLFGLRGCWIVHVFCLVVGRAGGCESYSEFNKVLLFSV